ncbi:hypothetical protein HPC49_05425 [Pyxidicoccus fallax]|uniref:Uncharacterized protein n=1 Tax=Pyxidicoccus fallax TaxID=394095 RepID=A0A848LD73_9BACT|nr:hypothetical protein [Pyxidicoccus fallax]NMO14733.1 hypothetical protein [Pyxidicoccus fallax]NPC77694.1 hypothetical protein [Pyxidicoccus fallax]
MVAELPGKTDERSRLQLAPTRQPPLRDCRRLTELTFYWAAKRPKRLGVPVLPNVVAAVGTRMRQCHVDLDARLHSSVEPGYGGMGVVVAPGAVVAGIPGRELKRK